MRYEIIKRSDNVPCIYLNLEDIKIEGIDKNDPLLVFPIHAYPKMITKTDTGDIVSSGRIDAINNMFSCFDKNDLEIIAINLLVIHNRLNECFDKNDLSLLHDACIDISKLLIDLNKTINLYYKCLTFVRDNINVIYIVGGGTRSHDTEDKTYPKEEVTALHGMVFVCKILLPIFGRVFYGLNKVKLDIKAKEIHCLTMVLPMFNESCPDVINKFTRYIKAILSTKFKEDRSTIHHGLDNTNVELKTLANILIRTSINHDVYREKSNLIKAFMDAMIADANNACSNIKKKAYVDVRIDPASSSEDNMQSQLEVNSITSHMTADIPLIAKTFSGKICKSIIAYEELDHKQCYKLMKFIHDSKVAITPLNKLVIQTVFNYHYLGLNNIEYLKLTEISQLLGVVQAITCKLGMNELTHALTALKSGRLIRDNVDQDRSILLGYTKLGEYRKYLDLMQDIPVRSKDMKDMFNKVLANIVTNITTYEYVYNTCDCISDEFDDGYKNGTSIKFTTVMFSQLYNLLYRFWKH